MKTLIKICARWVWRLSEATGISLGPLAPYILGAVVGRLGKRVR